MQNLFRILLVDDEAAILQRLSLVLQKEGFQELRTALTGGEALRLVREYRPHMIVLDIMLPDMDGYELCRRIRQESDAPVLFLTARSSDLDKLTGFSQGADDYMTKPFNPLEVVARIKVQQKRQNPEGLAAQKCEEPCYDFGRFQLYPQAGRLLVAGCTVECPAREFQLLHFLCRHPERIFSRSQLYEQVWGEESMSDDNTVMVHIRRLRERIEADPGAPANLVTVRGLGYKLCRHPEAGGNR